MEWKSIYTAEGGLGSVEGVENLIPSATAVDSHPATSNWISVCVCAPVSVYMFYLFFYTFSLFLCIFHQPLHAWTHGTHRGAAEITWNRHQAIVKNITQKNLEDYHVSATSSVIGAADPYK